MSDTVRRQLDEIVAQVAAGNVDAAEQLCRDALARDGNNVNYLGMLGAVLLKRGDREQAERALKRTIELAPRFARPHEDLAALYLSGDDPQRAADCFQRAIDLDGTSESARRGLAAALRRLAIDATEQENFAVAERHLRQLLKLSPKHVGAMMDLARFLGQRGRYPEAIAIMEEAAGTAPDNPDLRQLQGDMLAVLGRSADALRCYRACLALRPDDPAALMGAGHMLRIEGDAEGAEASYRRCTELRPALGDAWWNLASLPGYTADDGELLSMQAQIDKPSTPPEAAVAFHFALARAYERRHDYETAWRHYLQGNAGKRALVRYDPVETEVQQQKIRDTFTTALFDGEAARVPTDRAPVFIVGLPRSGSTLIEQILASHPQVTGAGELPYIVMLSNALGARRQDGVLYPELVTDLSLTELAGLGRSYLRHAESHLGDTAAHFTDKMPANFTHVGFIRLILPHARVIDARRDPMATCVANFRQLFAQGKNQSYDLMELGEYYLQYVATMDHWDTVLPHAVLRVNYEDVVADLEGQVRRILDYCSLPFDEACVAFHRSDRAVNTASAEQVRQPIYRSAVDFWKRYEPWLDELREVLAPVIRGQRCRQK